MKKLIIPAAISAMILGAMACQKKFLDLKPEDRLTEVQYFNSPAQFKAATNEFYEKMISWQKIDNSNIFEFIDMGSDLCADFTQGPADYGRGLVTVPMDDIYWNNAYAYIRGNNIVLQKAEAYSGDKKEIAQYVAAAKFFRAWHHFFLLKRFGGVPIVTTVPDITGAELQAPRNSRYEVVDQILKDLTEAIPDLPIEQAIPSDEKGHLSKWAAEAFKARVLLYEATWRKYTGNSTDFKGSGGPAYDQINEFLTEAATLAKDVIQNGGYKLWNYNSNTAMKNRSNYYLFCIDGTGSNPLGLDKSSNNEFILKSIYDVNLRPGGRNISATVQSYMVPSRKFMDMFLSINGMPIEKTAQFKGYATVEDEYQNRDFRLQSYILGDADAPAAGKIKLTDATEQGYTARKFSANKYPTYRAANKESQDYPQIRLAEVYLIYAEALMEKNKSISDADLNMSINLTRARAGVAPLTNKFATDSSLNILDEIRRERTVELFSENSRFDDLKRWGIAEHELNQNVCGMVVGGVGYKTDFRTVTGDSTSLYNPNVYVNKETTVATGKGNLKAILIDRAEDRNFKRTHYLLPIPLRQIQLNANLVQNNGY
ncbi:hypothetical protein A4H97_24030 [Niastella yeongjuensis]|uniref:Carbohydrate-binding protein SusD n=1 Tax=Niastella yeongjuensis TaxID=354355 RepID=A0A1V9F3F3_9BACT|nr:RagB/SusD family nutrient uptake outer membrane protein [Niastella yeongjuensis]OQP52776.1 hypothetical protein A4H97_24030 [Niastella yeongjuensis]SEP19426.1 Starch-binding associating with outer membrane [Niastella yeongjuensis]